MADGALERFQRLLRVLPLLADGEPHSYASIAERSGVPVATIIADLRAVAEREDDPGGYVASLQIQLDGKAAAVISAPFQRPMRRLEEQTLGGAVGFGGAGRQFPRHLFCLRHNRGVIDNNVDETRR